MENLSAAKFKTICANVFLEETGEPILPKTAVIETSAGLKLGFFGIETPETVTKVHPAVIKQIRITAFEELYKAGQEAVDELKAENVDLVFGLLHLGMEKESSLSAYRSKDFLQRVSGVDFAIDGHSHYVMTEGQDGEPIQSTGTKFSHVGVIVIDNETKKIEDHFLVPTYNGSKLYTAKFIDEGVAARAQEIMAKVNEEYGAPFARSEVHLNGEKAPGNRTEETNMGDLITDAMVWYVAKEGGLEQTELNDIVGITNGGGIRASIEVGDVSRKNVNTVLPFGNTVAVVYVTGNELLEALEASTFCTPDSIGGFPQTSGIQWTLDTTKPYDKGEVYIVDGKETSYFAPASIQRVSIQKINGEDFDPEKVYAVVTNNFCSAGGDTYNVFVRNSSSFDTAIAMDEAVMAYITDVLNGVITEEAYGAPRGSLTIIQ
jgi:5'-nucleotidase